MDPEYTAPVGDSTPASGVPASPPTSTEQPAGTPAPTGASPGSAAPAAQPPRDANGEFVPRSRLNEVTARARREIEQYQRRIQEFETVAGRQPPPPVNAEAEAIKRQLFELVPELKALAGIPADKLQGLLQMAPQLEAHTKQYWTNVGGHTLRQLHDAMEKAYGGPVDAKARTWVQAAFTNWLENDQDAYARYINQDPSLAQEFFANFQKLMLDPIGRSALAREQRRAETRRGLPNAGPRTTVQANGNPPTKPKDDDERGALAWAAFQQQR